MRAAQTKNHPLAFLNMLAHDIRWRILLSLSRSDHRVGELVKQIKQPHNLISYHLKRLRLQQLVSERRSSADARDIYYSLNLDQFRQMYIETGRAFGLPLLALNLILFFRPVPGVVCFSFSTRIAQTGEWREKSPKNSQHSFLRIIRVLKHWVCPATLRRPYVKSDFPWIVVLLYSYNSYQQT